MWVWGLLVPVVVKVAVSPFYKGGHRPEGHTALAALPPAGGLHRSQGCEQGQAGSLCGAESRMHTGRFCLWSPDVS